MATKKKTDKKRTKSKRRASKRMTPMKKAAKTKLALRKQKNRKKPAKKRTPRRAVAVKSKAVGKKKASRKTAGIAKKQVRGGLQSFETPAFSRRLGADSAGQSGDLQGLSNRKIADSESVDELLEEGNAFEADVVAGVEDADDADEREVHTHEVPEDDVPDEYLDKD
jgi:hypothetical protein